MCYRNNLKMEEVVITCEDFYNLPSKEAATQAMVKLMENQKNITADQLLKTKDYVEKFLNGKFTCSKVGFKKGCLFVVNNDDFKMGCHDLPIFHSTANATIPEQGPILPSLQYSVETIIREFGDNNSTNLPVKECFCDTDRCNAGNKPAGLPAGLLAAVICLTLGLSVFFK